MNAPSIDGFTLLRELGRGGMGIVYEASHPSAPERRLALKVLLAHADPNPDSLARFEREARLMGAINHPHVIRVHTFGRCPQGPYLVTEFIEGQDLKQLRQARPLPEPHLLQLMIGVCHAVEALHQHKILHRDLKPDNVMVRPDGSPVLLDFGLAREVGGERLTQTGASMGTPQYMAPEQAAGESPAHMNERTDVYGLGATLYFLIAGRPPFEGAQTMSVIAKVLTEPPDPKPLADAPSSLRAVCLKALSKERLARYPNVAALREDLERVGRGERTLARLPGRRRPWLFAGALTCALGVIGWALTRPGPETTASPPPAEAASPAQDEEEPRGLFARTLSVPVESVHGFRSGAPVFLDERLALTVVEQAQWPDPLELPTRIPHEPLRRDRPLLLLWDLGRADPLVAAYSAPGPRLDALQARPDGDGFTLWISSEKSGSRDAESAEKWDATLHEAQVFRAHLDPSRADLTWERIVRSDWIINTVVVDPHRDCMYLLQESVPADRSPDLPGSDLAGTLWVCDTRGETLRRVPSQLRGRPYDACLSPDGTYLVAVTGVEGGGDNIDSPTATGEVAVWNLTSERQAVIEGVSQFLATDASDAVVGFVTSGRDAVAVHFADLERLWRERADVPRPQVYDDVPDTDPPHTFTRFLVPAGVTPAIGFEYRMLGGWGRDVAVAGDHLLATVGDLYTDPSRGSRLLPQPNTCALYVWRVPPDSHEAPLPLRSLDSAWLPRHLAVSHDRRWLLVDGPKASWHLLPHADVVAEDRHQPSLEDLVKACLDTPK